jgi:predicted nucleic-acid-binding protein
MTETVWVLERAYRLSNVRIAEVIERLLQTSVLVIENEAEVFAAMTVLQEGSGSFADALIGELGDRAGCSVTLTFDQKAARLRNFGVA